MHFTDNKIKDEWIASNNLDLLQQLVHKLIPPSEYKLSRNIKKIVKLRTSPNKFRQSLARFTEWIRSNRSKRIRRLLKTLNSKLRGHYNYYGVINNFESIYKYYRNVRRILFKWLNRRSQRKSYNWKQFDAMLIRHNIETPRITECHNGQLNFKLI